MWKYITFSMWVYEGEKVKCIAVVLAEGKLRYWIFEHMVKLLNWGRENTCPVLDTTAGYSLSTKEAE